MLGPGQAASWTADRGAVNGLTRAAAHALGFYGINVNAVARGNTARKPYNAGVLERVRRLPLGRTETAEDMVEPCVFLASDGASYVTGTILYVEAATPSPASPMTAIARSGHAARREKNSLGK